MVFSRVAGWNRSILGKQNTYMMVALCRPDAYVLPWYAAQNDQGQKMCPFAFSAAQVQIMLGGIHINKIWLTNDLTKAEEVARKIQEAEEKISQGRDNKASFFASTESALTLKTAENWGTIPSLEVKGILDDMAREINALKGHPGTNKAIIRMVKSIAKLQLDTGTVTADELMSTINMLKPEWKGSNPSMAYEWTLPFDMDDTIAESDRKRNMAFFRAIFNRLR